MKQTIILKRLLLFFFFCLASVAVFAQPPIDGDPGGGGVGAIPVDGGLAFLLAAGVGYGAKKAYEGRRRSSQKSVKSSQ
jgi:hypothetical protein